MVCLLRVEVDSRASKTLLSTEAAQIPSEHTSNYSHLPEVRVNIILVAGSTFIRSASGNQWIRDAGWLSHERCKQND